MVKGPMRPFKKVPAKRRMKQGGTITAAVLLVAFALSFFCASDEAIPKPPGDTLLRTVGFEPT